MLLADAGRSADVTADVARRRERTAIVPLRLEDDDVDFGQEEQHERHGRRRAHCETVNDRSTLRYQPDKHLPRQ